MPVRAPEIDLLAIGPELALAGAAILVLLLDAWRPARNQRLAVGLTLLGLATAAVFTVTLWGEARAALGEMVAVDRVTLFFRLVIVASAAVATLFSATYLARTGEARGEYYALLLFATSGMTLLTAAADFIVVFLSLEVLSLSLYVMAGFSRRRLASQEASMKYFLLGAFSSAFFLYGIALTYGATGTTNIARVGFAVDQIVGGGSSLTLLVAGAALLAVGFGFKVAAVPFHMWTPDVYQGAPTPVTAFMAAGTKVAGFAALLRVTFLALAPVGDLLVPALWAISALTMVVGSVLAIAQTDMKRILAYSSIAHAGFVLVGVVAANQQGLSGAMFYLAAYAAMILGAFGIVALVSRRGEEHTSLVAYEGLYRRSPALAALLTLFLLSLAGIPPTAGFTAKLLVFQAAVIAGHWALVVVAVLASVVAAFFYIRVIVVMYMQEPEEAGAIPMQAIPGLGLAVTAAVTLGLFVFPTLLLDPILGP